jgi:hypothetical protein
MVSETIELDKFLFLQNAYDCVHEAMQLMDIDAEIPIQSGGIRFTDPAGTGVRRLNSASPSSPRKGQETQNADLDNANHGSPP